MDHRSHPNDSEHDARRIWLEQSKTECLERIAQREVAYKAEISRRKADYTRILAQIEQEYNDDLQDLVFQVRKLDVDLNAFLPISRLPPEILSHIFVEFSTDYWAKFWKKAANTVHLSGLIRSTAFRYYPWRMLKHVCKRWQDIVLQTPALFTWIIPDRLDIVNFEIQKSGTLPLDIIWFSSGNDDGMDCVLSALPRARSMVMWLCTTVLGTMRPGSIGSIHAPHLASIDYRIELASDYRGAIPILSELDVPNLTSLSTSDGSLELLKTFTRPTLTCLHMSDWSQQNWTATELLQLLGSLPALRTLSLCFSARNIMRYAPGSMPVEHITLPHLNSLLIHSERGSSGLAKLLDHITCPSLTTLRYWPGLARQNIMQDVLMTAMQTKMRTTALCNSFLLRAIAILDHPGSRHVTLGVWDSEQPDVSMLEPMFNHRDEFENMTGSFFASRISSMESVAEMVLPMFNLSHVTSIHLKYDIDHTPLVVWRGLFRATPALCILRAPLRTGLVEILDVSKTEGQESPILPRLRVLDLRGTLPAKLDPADDLLDSLVTCLQCRQTVIGRSLDRFEVSITRSIWGTPRSLIDAKIAKVIEFDGREYAVDPLP